MKPFIRLMIIGFITVLLGACSDKDNTLQPSPLVDFTPTVQIQTLWSAKVGDGASKHFLRLTPAISGGKIFVPDYDGDVIAVDQTTGQTIWKQNISNALTSGISADRGQIFVGMGDGEVAALRQSDGALLWRTPVSSEILTTPTAFHGIVFVKSIDGSLTALSEHDGQQLWRFQQEVPSLILHAASQPEIAGNYVIAGFANGKLAAINYSNGQPAWLQSVAEPQGSTAIEQMVDIDVNPVVVRGIIYVATYQGKIAAVDLRTGNLIWRHDISSYAGIAADDQHLYLSDAKSYVWAFDNDSGAVSWRQMQLSGRQVTGPEIFGNYVVVGDFAGYLHFLNKRTGDFSARIALDDSGLIAPPVTSGNILYAYTVGGTLYAMKIAQ